METLFRETLFEDDTHIIRLIVLKRNGRVILSASEATKDNGFEVHALYQDWNVRVVSEPLKPITEKKWRAFYDANIVNVRTAALEHTKTWRCTS